MLKLTLYKNCILNETYQNVISTGKLNGTSILEKYLNKLDKKIVNIENAYYTNSGQFIFDFELLDNLETIYEYNYLKCELFDEDNIRTLVRYCFINNIEIMNELVYLYYNEDIWSSYSDKIKGITESYLKRSRIHNYGTEIKLKSLPIKYDGNEKLEIIGLMNNASTSILNKKFKIMLEVQMYKLEQAGQATNKVARKIYYFMLYDNEGGSTFTWANVYARLEEIMTYVSSNFIQRTNPSDNNIYRFEIGDIYLLPENFSISVGTTNFRFKDTEDTSLLDYHLNLKQLTIVDRRAVFTKEIVNDYKNFSLGTFSSQLPIENNGTNFTFEILMSANYSNLAFYLSFQNQLIDITKDYKFDLPFSTILSEELSQRNIARELKISNIDMQKDKEQMKTAKNSVNNIYGAASDIMGGILGNLFPFGSTEGTLFGINALSKASNKLTQTALDIYQNERIQKRYDEQKALINSPVYSNSTGIFGNSTSFVNITNGIILTKINSDNDEFVKKTINNFGYVIYEFINDFSYLKTQNPDFVKNLGANYDVVKFEISNVYGEFPRSIAVTLNTILESGVKIWYDENLEEDNYVI